MFKIDWKLLAFATIFVIVLYALCKDHNIPNCAATNNTRSERRACGYKYFCSFSIEYLVLTVLFMYLLGAYHNSKY